MAFSAPQNPVALTVLLFTVTVVVLQIIALATPKWSYTRLDTTISGVATSIAVQIDVRSNFQLDVVVAGSGPGSFSSDDKLCPSSDNGEQCARVKAAYALTIISVVFFGVSIAASLFLSENKMLFAGLLFLAATCGMIGWAVWYGAVQKDSFPDSIKLALLGVGTTDTASVYVGYSQALAIAAWTTGYVAAVLAVLAPRGNE